MEDLHLQKKAEQEKIKQNSEPDNNNNHNTPSTILYFTAIETAWDRDFASLYSRDGDSRHFPR